MQVCKSKGVSALDVSVVLGCDESEIIKITRKESQITESDFMLCLKKINTDEAWKIWDSICDSYVAKDQLIAYANIVKTNMMIENK